MDKFWEWMNEKGYNVLYINGQFLIDLYDKAIPKQMLVGYLIEYISETILKQKETVEGCKPFHVYNLNWGMLAMARDLYGASVELIEKLEELEK